MFRNAVRRRMGKESATSYSFEVRWAVAERDSMDSETVEAALAATELYSST